MIRIFGSSTCRRCGVLTSGLKLLNRPFVFIDAMAPENDPICDEFEVDALPHVQIIDENTVVLWQKSDKVSLTDIVAQLKRLGQ